MFGKRKERQRRKAARQTRAFEILLAEQAHRNDYTAKHRFVMDILEDLEKLVEVGQD